MERDLYIGKWQLIPELCLYQVGDVPLSATYEITEVEGVVSISICWKTLEGSDLELAFSGPTDGSRQSTDAPGEAELSISRVSNTILDSSAYLDGEEIMFARRSASLDGRLLSTVQTGTTGDTPFRNFQVYSRYDA